MRAAFTVTIWCIAATSALTAYAADDEPQPSKVEKRAAQRLEIMRGAIEDFQVAFFAGR